MMVHGAMTHLLVEVCHYVAILLIKMLSLYLCSYCLVSYYFECLAKHVLIVF